MLLTAAPMALLPWWLSACGCCLVVAALVAFCVWLCQDAYECCLLNVTAAVEQGGNHFDLIVFKFSAAEQVTSCLLLLINNKLLLAGHNPCHQLLP
jgi:hypothetical protein